MNKKLTETSYSFPTEGELMRAAQSAIAACFAAHRPLHPVNRAFFRKDVIDTIALRIGAVFDEAENA